MKLKKPIPVRYIPECPACHSLDIEKIGAVKNTVHLPLWVYLVQMRGNNFAANPVVIVSKSNIFTRLYQHQGTAYFISALESPP